MLGLVEQSLHFILCEISIKLTRFQHYISEEIFVRFFFFSFNLLNL